MKKKKKIRNIILGICNDPYVYPGKPLILWENSDVTCGDLIMKYRPWYRTNHQFGFICEYLRKKRIPLDISGFREKDLGDIVRELQDQNKKNISLKRLIEIYHWENQIASIKKHQIEKISHYFYKKHWKERNKAITERNWAKLSEMEREFRAKSELAHKIINRTLK